MGNVITKTYPADGQYLAPPETKDGRKGPNTFARQKAARVVDKWRNGLPYC